MLLFSFLSYLNFTYLHFAWCLLSACNCSAALNGSMCRSTFHSCIRIQQHFLFHLSGLIYNGNSNGTLSEAEKKKPHFCWLEHSVVFKLHWMQLCAALGSFCYLFDVICSYFIWTPSSFCVNVYHFQRRT